MNDAEKLFKQLTQENEKFAVVRKKYNDYANEIDLHHKGQLIKPIKTGIQKLDQHFSFCVGQLVLLTGYSQSGKSEFSKFAAVRFVIENGGNVAIFSPESRTPLFLDELAVVSGALGIDDPASFVDKHFTIVEINDMSGMPDVDQILKEFEMLSLEDHNFFILDPMNWVTSNSYMNQMMVESLRIVLTRFKQFAIKSDSIVLYVEHPKTPQPNKDGEYPRCNVFMVNGGIMHNNKTDANLVIHRQKSFDGSMTESDSIELEVAKLKDQKYLGRPSTVTLDYDFRTGVYY